MRRQAVFIAVGTVAIVSTVIVVIVVADRSDTDPKGVGPEHGAWSLPTCDFRLEPGDGVIGSWRLAAQPCSLDSGWARPTRRGVTASSRVARLKVFVDRADWSQLVMRIKGPENPRGAQRVEVRLNGNSIGSPEISAGWRNISIEVPPGLLHQGANDISLSLADQQDTDDGGRPRDQLVLRRLALASPEGNPHLGARALRSLFEEPTEPPLSHPASSTETTPDQAETSSGGDRNDRLGDHARPDIILITLDAARPDHFSCSGYHRPTTPKIDLLARESLVFDNVFALVPNTRQSVPTMVTGLSFINHGVTADDTSTLSQEATTLAEYLQTAGYRTACLTATPNNSTTLGTDQGYDEFVELWTDESKTDSLNPHVLAGRAVEWLESNRDAGPIHLQLHFVPPHAPYEPRPEFDLFTEPDYDGLFKGFPDSILQRVGGRLAISSSDLEHVVASYDGNLRAADDAVGLVLSTLRNDPRWEETIVLVTSDHGEAFFEHRRMGHNNTVFDEMLRVPFILRLPAAIEKDGVDTDRLATLADIVPTLLALTGLESEIRLDGIDLLDAPNRPEGPVDRTFAIQTAHRQPTRGLRSLAWKVILTRKGRGELYDLERDPDEHINLAHDERSLFLERAAMLVQQFNSTPLLDRRDRQETLSDRDREMLKALGYMD
jgi:arylsulfatase A-like enzyme